MKTTYKFLLVSATIALGVLSARADLGSLFNQLTSSASTTNSTTAAVAALSDSEVVDGLKAALGNGVGYAVNSLGHDNGFLTNVTVKIPLPDKLQTVEKALRLAGQNKMADDFIASMNHAAEQAVPVAASVFADSIKQMSIADAKNILSGPDDAATQYFRRTTQTNLYAQFYPIVQKSTDQVGVTQEYKQMMSKFNSSSSASSLSSLGGLFGAKSPVSSINLSATDIDAYVTGKALDGLFVMVAAEEKSIRANPAARTTDLLQSVFGAAAK